MQLDDNRSFDTKLSSWAAKYFGGPWIGIAREVKHIYIYAPESKSIIDSRIILPVKSHSQIQELICNDWPSTLPKLLVLGQIVHSGYLQVVDTTVEKNTLCETTLTLRLVNYFIDNIGF